MLKIGKNPYMGLKLVEAQDKTETEKPKKKTAKRKAKK